MARRNSRSVRQDNLSQRELRKLERIKKNKNPRKDSRSWTDRLFDRLKEASDD